MKINDKTYEQYCKTCVWAKKVDAQHVLCTYSPFKCEKVEKEVKR